VHYDTRPLGHDKLDTTAHYTKVATGMISSITSPLDDLGLTARTLLKGKCKGPSRGKKGKPPTK
jgi:hypothetical protein